MAKQHYATHNGRRPVAMCDQRITRLDRLAYTWGRVDCRRCLAWKPNDQQELRGVRRIRRLRRG